MKKLLFSILCLLPSLIYSEVMKERRVYYLDCSYSMNAGNLNQKVCKNLKDALDKIEDQTTELYIIPFAFDNKDYKELPETHANATPEGKALLKEKIDNINWANKSTKTFHKDPIEDFYNNGRILQGGVTYMFLMTDGKDEWNDPNRFLEDLKQWGDKYGEKNVYGFYVMLGPEAKNSKVEQIINEQPHFWTVETAEVDIHITRAESKATFNIRDNKEYVEIPIVGKTKGYDIVSTTSNTNYQITKSEITDGKLRLYISGKKNLSELPSSDNITVKLKVDKTPGAFYFWVTETISIKCLNKPEPAIISYSVR